jgi:cation transport protein ChaC
MKPLSLTRELVEKARGHFPPGTPGVPPANRRPAEDADYRRIVAEIRAAAPPGDFWVFAYGSLIWNPGFLPDGREKVRIHGWHRSFCLGYDTLFRGCVERPGVMLALDRGGSCNGILYRMARPTLEADLDRLARREVRFLPPAFPPRWLAAERSGKSIRVLSFVIDRGAGRYVGGLTAAETAALLAAASGPMGSMADYLFNTVEHLAQEGLSDGMMWHLQELVAQNIAALPA